MLLYHQSRTSEKRKHHGRRAGSKSPSKNLKRRFNARRLVALAQDERLFKENWLLQRKSSTSSGLRGGGKDANINDNTLDQASFVDSIRYANLLDISSKKLFWETVARQYFGDLKVKKKRVEKLRLAWRRNEGGIREKVNKSYKDKNGAKLRECHKTSNSVSSDSENASDKEMHPESKSLPIKGKDKPSCFNEMTEFLGGVIGSAISSIYREHFMDENEYYDQPIQKTSSPLQGQFCPGQVQKGTTSSCSKSRRKIVKDLLSDDCLTYEKVYDQHGESEENKFLNIPNVSGVTAKSLSSSNVPSSGTFRAELSKDVSFVSLPSKWRDIPVKNVADQKRGKTHRAFDAGYTSFFSDILKKFNPYCCWIFKRNYIKKLNSRKKSSPYWCGAATCKFGDVLVQLKIANREEGVLEIRFTSDVCQNVTSAKAKKSQVMNAPN
jgi:hypothetical protein